MPLRAASAVRTLACTEIFMPMYPARPDKSAPIAKPIAVFQCNANPMTTKSTTPTMPIVVYCRLR